MCKKYLRQFYEDIYLFCTLSSYMQGSRLFVYQIRLVFVLGYIYVILDNTHTHTHTQCQSIVSKLQGKRNITKTNKIRDINIKYSCQMILKIMILFFWHNLVYCFAVCSSNVLAFVFSRCHLQKSKSFKCLNRPVIVILTGHVINVIAPVSNEVVS